MKKLITAIAIGAFAFVGTAVTSEARPYWERGHSSPNSSIYVSGYRHGQPIYTEKYVVGYDRYGHPRFAYRTVSAPRRHYTAPCPQPRYVAPCPPPRYVAPCPPPRYVAPCPPPRYVAPCPPPRYSGHGHHGYHGRSGSSVSFTFRR